MLLVPEAPRSRIINLFPSLSLSLFIRGNASYRGYETSCPALNSARSPCQTSAFLPFHPASSSVPPTRARASLPGSWGGLRGQYVPEKPPISSVQPRHDTLFGNYRLSDTSSSSSPTFGWYSGTYSRDLEDETRIVSIIPVKGISGTAEIKILKCRLSAHISPFHVKSRN